MKTGFQILILIWAGFACKDNKAFDLSPSQRSAAHISALRKELVSAPYGWSVTYFPRMDSLLFAKADEVMAIPRTMFKDRFGYGGHSFLMKFSDNGTVQSVADYDVQSLAKARESEFEVGQNTFSQLSFSTYTYLHDLVNERFTGSMDFLYTGKDMDGNLLFKTSSYTEPAREYIVFTKLKDGKSWPDALEKAYGNKSFFEKMKNPQLKISRAGRIYFLSDLPMNASLDGGKNPGGKPQQEIYQRYHLFLSIAYFAPEGWTQKKVRGLGSGYVGTAEGLAFRPGIRYSETYTFCDFRREGNKFVCELVKVFDPYSKTARWVSKHLAPNGEETGVAAEIWDENKE